MTEIDLSLRLLGMDWVWTVPSHPLTRKAAKLTLDGLLAGLAFTGISVALLQGPPHLLGLSLFILLATAINVGFKGYAQYYRELDIEEARVILLSTLVLVLVGMTICVMRRNDWPGGGSTQVVLGASLATGPLWLGLRLARLSYYRRRQYQDASKPSATAHRTLIVGAGRAGVLLCRELQAHPERWAVVGFVDDALDKQGVLIHGLPVLGPTHLLPVYIREQQVTQVILGMAGVSGARLKELTALARAEGVLVKMVPGIMDLVGDRPWRPEVRDVAIEDLLRREPVALDCHAIRSAIEGAVVLITGGGGSIGGELARRVAGLRPARLILLGRGENSLWEAQRQLADLFPAQEVVIALCDIRNPQRLEQVFAAHRPGIVLHAAAHKHVPFLEDHPEEAIENNIFGTRNVMDAALDWGTHTFVNVSTDKAVNPVNVLGVSKRIGELIVAREAAKAGPNLRLVSVRFGNVLASRGSVIPIFKDQIRRGGPVTVTHPDMVRYFMTIPEAAQLVLQAGLLGETGKVFVLDMGAPVHIAELAREMVRLSGFSPGVDMEIQYTGVRPGEKLFEELFSGGEEQRTKVHLKVFEAVQDYRDFAVLDPGLRTLQKIITHPGRGRTSEILNCFMQMVPNYCPSPIGLGRQRLTTTGQGPAHEAHSNDLAAIA